jgi:DNA-binding XRE family transcriptional regulator
MAETAKAGSVRSMGARRRRRDALTDLNQLWTISGTWFRSCAHRLSMTEDRAILAENLRAVRKFRNLPQVELADLAGIDRSYISDIENGRYGVSIDKAGSLAAALGVKTWELLHPDTAQKYKSNAG